MRNTRGEILYIGKAKNLRKRVTSYTRVKPDNSASHILQMVQFVRAIEWRQCRSEQGALNLESELLRSIRPPFNRAQTEENPYLLIGVRVSTRQKQSALGRDLIRLDLHLSARDWIAEEGYQLYGCYPDRFATKKGYGALLRLLHAATFEGSRYHCPSRIAGRSPAWVCAMDLPRAWQTHFERFLRGQSFELVRVLFDRLLENETIPTFYAPTFEEDFQSVKRFYRKGPCVMRRASRELGRELGSLKGRAQASYLSQKELERWVQLKNRVSEEVLDPI